MLVLFKHEREHVFFAVFANFFYFLNRNANNKQYIGIKENHFTLMCTYK